MLDNQFVTVPILFYLTTIPNFPVPSETSYNSLVVLMKWTFDGVSGTRYDYQITVRHYYTLYHDLNGPEPQFETQEACISKLQGWIEDPDLHLRENRWLLETKPYLQIAEWRKVPLDFDASPR